MAPSILARLQLAALYAATSTLLPEPLTHRTGTDTALQLLRQCWGNGPLTPDELVQLRSVGRLGAHLAPQLLLLIHEREDTAWQLRHLRVAEGRAGATEPQRAPLLDTDAAAAYEATVREPVAAVASAAGGVGDGGGAGGRAWVSAGWGPNPRQLLTPGEEERVLGTCYRGLGGDGNSGSGVGWSGLGAPSWMRKGQFGAVEVQEQLPVEVGFVGEAEVELEGLVEGPPGGAATGKGAQRGRGGGGLPAYPLRPGGGAGGGGGPTPLQRDMHDELEGSWMEHHRVARREGRRVAAGTLDRVRQLRVSVWLRAPCVAFA